MKVNLKTHYGIVDDIHSEEEAIEFMIKLKAIANHDHDDMSLTKRIKLSSVAQRQALDALYRLEQKQTKRQQQIDMLNKQLEEATTAFIKEAKISEFKSKAIIT